MLLDLLVNHQIPYILGGVTIFGVLLNLMEDSIYKRYLRHTAQLERKPRTWPGQLKTRFETYYKRKTGVRKVDLFVKNSLDGRKFLGIRLRTWTRFSSQIPPLVLGGGLAAALYASLEHFSAQECMRLLGCGALFALAGRIAERVIGVPESRERLQNALNDYFSNLLRPRMEQQYMRRPAYLLPAAEPVLTEETTSEAPVLEVEAAQEQQKAPVMTVEEFRGQKAEHLRKKRREEREQKAERERLQQQTRLAERRRRAEERAKKQQEALQAAYEEKKRKLENKYISLQKEASASAAGAEAAAAALPPAAEPKEPKESKTPKEPEKEIACTAENMADPDFIEEVLREYLL